MIRKALPDAIFVSVTVGLALVMGLSAAIGAALGRGQHLPAWWGVVALAALFGLALAAFAAVRLRVRARALAGRRALDRDLEETRALYRLLAENATEVVLRTAVDGRIAYASPAIARHSRADARDFAGHSLADIVDPSYTRMVMGLHEAAIHGAGDAGRWGEFVATGLLVQGSGEEQDGTGKDRWFEIQVHPLQGEDGQVYGAVSILRNIDERKRFQEQLFEAALTDPLTGLSNRRAFVAMLQHYVEEGNGGCLAMFDLDHFKAINDQYGHAVGDKVLMIFAELARSQVRSEDMVARIGGEKFAVVLPRASADQAEQVCSRILTTYSGTTRVIGDAIVRTTASAGVARMSGSADDTMRTADLALFTAKAKGRDRLEMASRLRGIGGKRW